MATNDDQELIQVWRSLAKLIETEVPSLSSVEERNVTMVSGMKLIQDGKNRNKERLQTSNQAETRVQRE